MRISASFDCHRAECREPVRSRRCEACAQRDFTAGQQDGLPERLVAKLMESPFWANGDDTSRSQARTVVGVDDQKGAGDVRCSSTAPRSTWRPSKRGEPRWSRAKMLVRPSSPASIAGEPTRACGSWWGRRYRRAGPIEDRRDEIVVTNERVIQIHGRTESGVSGHDRVGENQRWRRNYQCLRPHNTSYCPRWLLWLMVAVPPSLASPPPWPVPLNCRRECSGSSGAFLD